MRNFKRVLAYSLCLLVVGVFSFSAYGQDANPFIPSDEALNNTVIPIRDRVALAARLMGIEAAPVVLENVSPLNVGDQKVFYVSNTSTNEVLQVPATLYTVGEHIYLWVEDSRTPVDESRLFSLAETFDAFIYEAVREIWGSEDIPGIDGDPRVHALISYGVGSSVAAYFMNDNTLPAEVVSHSNEHEMFLISGLVFNSYELEYIESIIAHEFQHMIRANVQFNEETWMNEGFSEFTQFHLYPSLYTEVSSFLLRPDTQLNSWAEDYAYRPANYGAAGLFVSYFYDRYGMDALQQLSRDNAPRGLQSVDNVLAALGEPDVNQFFADWVVANYIFDPTVGTGIYGYSTIPAEMGILRPDRVAEFPTSLRGTVSQYAADYYQLRDWNDAQTLTITLDAPQEVNIIPVEAHNGERFAYSNRADMSNTRMTRAFDLTAVEHATLEFKLWHHFEELWDYGYVMVSVDGGESWDILTGEHTRSENPYLNAYGDGYTGKSGDVSRNAVAEWVKEVISLDAYAGQEILIRFEAITDDALNQHGMAIDDVTIPEIAYMSDFETLNDWVLEGWIWTDNRLEQRAWVQVIQETPDDVIVNRLEYRGQATTNTWSVDIVANAERITVVLSAFAPVTTVPMPYELHISEG